MHSVVVSVDGGSRGNDSKNSESRAAYGVFFGSGCAFNQCGLLAHRVAQVSGRAEMEAVRQALLAVLRRRKAGEIDGFREIILKTDSTYVANTFDDWVWAWKENGWRRKNGEKIKNLDLVKDIHTIICKMEADNMAVRFWRVDRQWNMEADALVNEAFDSICDSEYGEA
jgi:ribonuclease HI